MSHATQRENTLLEFAVEENAMEAVKYLLEAGAKLENGFYKPLIHAAVLNRMEILRLLLEAGADPNITCSEEDERGLTALMYAVEPPPKLKVIELLLSHNANPNSSLIKATLRSASPWTTKILKRFDCF